MRRMTSTSRLRAMGAFRGLAAFGTSSGEAPPDIPAGGALYLPSPLYCFSDDGGTIPCAIGDQVAVWKDYYGVASSFTQTTAANRPTLQFAQGRHVVRMDATNDGMTSSYVLDSGNTIYVAEIPAANTAAQRTINSSDTNSLMSCGRASAGSYVAFQGGTISGDGNLTSAGALGYASNFWNGGGTAVVYLYPEPGEVSSGATPGNQWGTVTLGSVGLFGEPGKTDIVGMLFYNSSQIGEILRLNALFDSLIA